MNTRSTVLVVTLLSFLMTGCYAAASIGDSQSASGPASSPSVPANGVLVGTSAPPRHTRSRLAEIAHLERLVGRRFDIDHRYSIWLDRIPTPEMRTTIAQGRILLLNWNPRGPRGGAIAWANIAAGKYDSWIASRADAFRALRVPVLIAFHHEPESSRGTHGSLSDYRRAWHRIVSIFRERGARNVEWVWIMMAQTFAPGASPPPDAYYPGDQVVDWIAVDGYNWFGWRGRPWRSFEEIFAPFYAWASPRGKPLMIAEFGLLEDRANPARKPLWINEMRQTLTAWPAVKALVYYNSQGWWFDSSPGAVAAFAALANDPSFRVREAAQDRERPGVRIKRPRNRAAVKRRSTVRVVATASDDTGVRHVEFWVNGRRRCADDARPYACRWYVGSRRGARNLIRVVAHDVAGRKRSRYVSVWTR